MTFSTDQWGLGVIQIKGNAPSHGQAVRQTDPSLQFWEWIIKKGAQAPWWGWHMWQDEELNSNSWRGAVKGPSESVALSGGVVNWPDIHLGRKG